MTERVVVRLGGLVLIGSLLVTCSKPADKAGSTASSTAAPAATAAAPAAPAAASAAAPTAASTATPGAAPAAAAGAGAGVADTTARLAGAEWALRQDAIKNDPDGQWAIAATASSCYGNAQGTAGFSAMQATGSPNVDRYGDNSNAWAPSSEDAGIEWLDLTFAKPVHAAAVRVRESAGSGAVIKVELFEPNGAAHTVWQGLDPTKELNYLEIKFPATDYLTNHAKVTLATNTIPGWNEIDAVQLVGKP
jgi:pyruvate/2-oxoglutarate dehydrogenase complex dihydrolipoamide acyltransferase (E2) component